MKKETQKKIKTEKNNKEYIKNLIEKTLKQIYMYIYINIIYKEFTKKNI